MRRRAVLATLATPMAALAQGRTLPLASPVDAVHLYVIPTDGMPEALAETIARGLTLDTGLWIKATTWAPPGALEPFPGTNQYAGEDYIALGTRLARTLPEVSPRTYFIVLTDRDINSRSRNFRFQFSLHSPMSNTSVLSVARLLYGSDGRPATNDVVGSRAAKMLLRIVGEMRMGWQRSGDPTDLMYAPIMSTDDIDRIDLANSWRLRHKQR
ncbi:MAG: hypothetical protein L6Q73_09240 [Aquabacterium sp.]|nr:hypothetical protein [Aquabacterium sp.]